MGLREACIMVRDSVIREFGYWCGRFSLPRSLYRAVRDHTMCSIQRLDNMYRLARSVEESKLHGAIVECGVWKGGCVGVAAVAVRESGYRRQIHLFDSFAGLPEPGAADGAAAAAYSDGRSQGRLESTGKCVASQADVEALLFHRLGIQPSAVCIHAGWFQETLPRDHGKIGPIALLRLDGDWYDSTRVCLKYLYPHVVSGGYIILDDYGHWEGCRKALEEYWVEAGVRPQTLVQIDYTGVYFVKP